MRSLKYLFIILIISARCYSSDYYFKNGKKINVQKLSTRSCSNKRYIEGFDGVVELSGYLTASLHESEKPNVVAERYELELIRKIPRARNAYLFRSSDPVSVSSRMYSEGSVRWAEPDFFWNSEVKGSDDPFQKFQWYLENDGRYGREGDDSSIIDSINFIKELGLDPGKGVVVGVIDDGFDLKHEDLVEKFLEGYDTVDGDNVPLYSHKFVHGTAVTGVLAAESGNGIGISGVCPGCMVVPVAIGDGFLNTVQLVDAFNFLLDMNVDVISNSYGPTDNWGYMDMPEALKEIVENSVEKGRNGRGTVIVFASGNGNESIDDVKSFDGFAAHPDVIAVGSVNATGQRAVYSDFGASLDIMAPSCDIDPGSIFDHENLYGLKDPIWTTDVSGEFGYSRGSYDAGFCGTSASAPMVSAIAGLIIGANPDLSAKKVQNIIQLTADRVSPIEAQYDERGHSDFYGYGRINALEAVKKACESGCSGIDSESGEPFYRDIDIDNPAVADNINDHKRVVKNSGCSLVIIN